MGIEAWLQAAIADAERRGLPELTPLLKALALTTAALRSADITRPELKTYAGHPRRADD